MLVGVYILVQVERGEPWKIADKIKKIESVETIHTVTGQYDIIVYAKLKDLDLLKGLVTSIHQIDGVQHTQTAVCIP